MLTVKSRPSAAAPADDGSSKAASRPSEPQERRQRHKVVCMEARFWLTKDTFYLALLLILLVQSAWWFSRDRDAMEENIGTFCQANAMSTAGESAAAAVAEETTAAEATEDPPSPEPEEPVDPGAVKKALDEIANFPAPDSIPGTLYKTAEEAAAIQRKIDCLARVGRWQLNESPRWIAWDLNPLNNPQQPDYKICDKLWAASGKGVYGIDAERARLRKEPWKVRKPLKYQWVTKHATSKGPYRHGPASGSGNASDAASGEEAGGGGRKVGQEGVGGGDAEARGGAGGRGEGQGNARRRLAAAEDSEPEPGAEGEPGSGADTGSGSAAGSRTEAREGEGAGGVEVVTPCQFRQFNRDAFCRAAAGLNIVVVGDSLQLQFHDSLLNHLVDPRDPMNETGDLGDARTPCGGHTLCGHLPGVARVHLRVIRNDQLSLTKDSKAKRNQPWVRFLRAWKPDMLILNRGAHFRSNAMFKKQMRSTLQVVRKKYPKLLVVWRNTPPGHDLCYTKKFKRVLKVRQDIKKAALPFSWGKFRKQNIAARSLMASFGILYMDVDAATALRGDGHIQKEDKSWDCLHYCIPGPVDHWVNLLFNMFLVFNQTLQQIKSQGAG